MNDEAFITINAPHFAAQIRCSNEDVKRFLDLVLPFLREIGERNLKSHDAQDPKTP